MSAPDNMRLNLSAGLASVAIAGVMVALKLWAYGTTGSLSVAASLADSAMDLMVSLGAMAALIYAAKPADEDHAFGHSSAEDLAAFDERASEKSVSFDTFVQGLKRRGRI